MFMYTVSDMDKVCLNVRLFLVVYLQTTLIPNSMPQRVSTIDDGCGPKADLSQANIS